MTTTTNSRPSFLLYKSFYAPVKHLKDDELGLLFRALFDYQNGVEIVNLPPQVGMAFAFFKNQFDLDDQKYQVVLERNKSNGSKGGRPKKEETQVNPENPVGFYEPRKGEKEKENGIDKEIEIEKGKNILVSSQFESFWNLYDKKKSRPDAEKKFKAALKKDTFENIMAGLEKYIKARGSDSQYWKHPSTWLNQECWKDEHSIQTQPSDSKFAAYSHLRTNNAK